MAARVRPIFPFILLVLLAPARAFCAGSADDYERARSLRERVANKAPRSPRLHWLSPEQAWFVDQQPGRRTTMLVSREQLRPAFDHQRLAAAINKAADKQLDAALLRVEWLALADEPKRLRLAVDGQAWSVDLDSYEVERLSAADAKQAQEKKGPQPHATRRRGHPSNAQGSRRESPDGRWAVELRDNNVHLRDRQSKQQSQLTDDGAAEDAYQDRVYWSPDSQKFVVIRRRPGQDRQVHLIESAPKDQLQPKLNSRRYLKPGDKISQDRPQLFHVDGKRQVELKETQYSKPWSIGKFHWSPDSQRFTFLYNQRGHQLLRLLTVEADTGETGVLLEESSETFIDYAHKEMTYYVGGDEILWLSERDGWNHLYLIDARTGAVKNQITRGEWVIRHVDRVDAERRQIWFYAGGVYPAQEPYYRHYCRVDFDGGNLTLLTSGNGDHEVEWSPDRTLLIDRYSRVDMPPVTELREAESGELLHELHRSDWSELLKTGWQAPERLAFKGRDGATDIYGVLFRPANFDPAERYPVIESIYAGPHGSHCPKQFRSYYKEQALAELGFIVVKLDGMGTSHRSKAFHDVCWQNLGDSGFPDRIAWIKAAAADRPWMDLQRVGIYGGSAGGQSSTRALLAHGDFYHVAVSDCGCHDNRMDKIWWNELWMGWPVGPHYAEQSNVTQAHRLQGKLLLIVGELDRNVDPASTMQVVNALIKADKDFDMLVVPGGGHGVAESAYGTRRRRDFFVRHLLGVEPRHDP